MNFHINDDPSKLHSSLRKQFDARGSADIIHIWPVSQLRGLRTATDVTN